MKTTYTYYPKPKNAGGKLIREAIACLRQGGKLTLPLKNSDILIAVSGGPDSIALARLLSRYGRRIVDQSSTLKLLHINHGWRGKESDEDENFVKSMGKAWDLKVLSFKVPHPLTVSSTKSLSWENIARQQRKLIYERLTEQSQKKRKTAWIFTAHQSDDLAETVLWRILSGAPPRLYGGILVRSGQELRPFLRVRKHLILQFLAEEGVSYRLDSTNSDPRFLRARMRLELLPAVERLFPKAVEQLVTYGLRTQKLAQTD